MTARSDFSPVDPMNEDTTSELSRGRRYLLGFGLASAVGLLLFTYRALDDVARGSHTPALARLIEEMTAVYAVALLLPLVARFARRFRLDQPGAYRFLPLHLLALVAMSATHTSLNWATRSLLFPLSGLGSYNYGAMSVRYAMEFPVDVIIYSITVSFVYFLDRQRAARRRELRVSRLEAQLTRAQLDALRAQLNPHFLFNALNTVSSVMYEDVQRADAVLNRLAELLRRTMHTAGEQTLPLAEELEVLEMYLEVMRARFPERLHVDVAAAEAARAAAVPALLLQPLVENAIRHGEPPPPEPVRIRVEARYEPGARGESLGGDGARRAGEVGGGHEGGRLVIEIRDNGPGIGVPWRELLGRGIGLSNTVERLERLYGDAHRLELGNVPGGGLRVRLEIPYAAARREHALSMEAAWSA